MLQFVVCILARTLFFIRQDEVAIAKSSTVADATLTLQSFDKFKVVTKTMKNYRRKSLNYRNNKGNILERLFRKIKKMLNQ
jgi:hypothetical protein